MVLSVKHIWILQLFFVYNRNQYDAATILRDMLNTMHVNTRSPWANVSWMCNRWNGGNQVALEEYLQTFMLQIFQENIYVVVFSYEGWRQ